MLCHQCNVVVAAAVTTSSQWWLVIPTKNWQNCRYNSHKAVVTFYRAEELMWKFYIKLCVLIISWLYCTLCEQFINIVCILQEHHLQQAIFHQRVIPVPEVYEWGAEDPSVLDRMYPPNYKVREASLYVCVCLSVCLMMLSSLAQWWSIILIDPKHCLI